MARGQALALGTLTLLLASVTSATDTPPPERRVIHEASGIAFIYAGGVYVGETEVTTGQFRKFVEATGYKTDAERGLDDGNGNGVGTFTALPEGEREWSKSTTWRTAFDRFAGRAGQE